MSYNEAKAKLDEMNRTIKDIQAKLALMIQCRDMMASLLKNELRPDDAPSILDDAGGDTYLSENAPDVG